MPFPVVLFDLYGTLLQSASGDIGKFQSLSIEGLSSQDPGSSPNSEPLEPLKPFLSILPQKATLTTLRTWFRKEVERRHKDLLTTCMVPEIRVEEVWSSILGLSKEEAFEFSLRFELTVNPVYPMPGAKEYIDFLKKKGILLGLISNAQAFTSFYVEALFGMPLKDLGFLPELTVFSYELGEAKPSPRLFQIAANSLSFLEYSPEQALYIGNDLQNDVWAPQQVGFRTALFCGDYRSLRLYEEDSQFAKVLPDFLIKSFERGDPCT